LGTARINRSLIPAIRAGERSTLVAVASRDQARADAYVRECQTRRACGSFEALVADPDIDAVYVPLPNHLHVEWTVAGARAGKHVLCEKPLALDAGGVDRHARALRKAAGARRGRRRSHRGSGAHSQGGDRRGVHVPPPGADRSRPFARSWGCAWPSALRTR